MTPAAYRTFTCDGFEAIESGGRAVVKDRATSRYFEVDTDALGTIAWCDRRSRMSAPVLAAYVTGLVLLGGINVASLWWSPTVAPGGAIAGAWSAFVVYAFLGVGLHEWAHIIALRAFGRRPDRIGFKLNYWVFPAVYVRMNETHMLTRCERVVVHSAGVYANCVVGATAICVNAAMLHSAVLASAVSAFTICLLFNVAPFLDSDGYKVLLAILDKREARDAARSGWVVKLIRMCGIAYVIWWLYSLFSQRGW